MGGVAIFFGLAVAMLVRYGVEAILGHAEITLSSRYYLNVNFWIVGAAFAVIFLTGLLDDIFFSQAYSETRWSGNCCKHRGCRRSDYR